MCELIARRFTFVFLVALLAGACGEQRPFDSAVWKAEAGTFRYESQRPPMLSDLRRRIPEGTLKAEILAQLGTPDASIPDFCNRRDADSCLVYGLGYSGVDEVYFVIAFRRERLMASWVRPT